MVEGRYWSCGVGGLWRFKGGWPGCLERSQAGGCGMDWTAMTPRWAPGRAGWAVSSDSQACPAPLSRGPGSLSLAPWPSAAWPPLHPALLSDCLFFPLFPPRPPLPSQQGSPFLSAAPSLCPPSSLQNLSFLPSGSDGHQRPVGSPPQLLDAHQSPVSGRVGSASVGTLRPGSPAKAAKAGRGPSPP